MSSLDGSESELEELLAAAHDELLAAAELEAAELEAAQGKLAALEVRERVHWALRGCS